MSLYVLRLRDGNCIIVDAPSEEEATARAQPLAASEVATVRRLESFVAQFCLTDGGELTANILDRKTVAELHQHEYPLLRAAHDHSYRDFGASETDSNTAAVRFSSAASRHAKQWDTRDKDTLRYAVEQERLRFAH